MQSQIHLISSDRARAMTGVTYHPGIASPIISELRLLEIVHLDFMGKEVLGELITAALHAPSIIAIFAKLYALGFPIQRMQTMVHYAGDDASSMADNNSSCFNSRRILNSERLSAHSFGAAIDINPIQNPVIRDGIVRPPAGNEYLDRSDQRKGMIADSSPELAAFTSAGWAWGGHWSNPRDYHHFYLPPRQ